MHPCWQLILRTTALAFVSNVANLWLVKTTLLVGSRFVYFDFDAATVQAVSGGCAFSVQMLAAPVNVRYVDKKKSKI